MEIGSALGSPPTVPAINLFIVAFDAEASAVFSQHLQDQYRACLLFLRHSPTIPQMDASGGFMFAIRSGNFQLGLMLATALAVSLQATPSRAYTPEQQHACSVDAFLPFSSELPDVDRVTGCMIRNKSH